MKTYIRIFLIITMLLGMCIPAHAESIYSLTNNSGGSVSSGTLVVLDTGATDSFTTSTQSYDTGMWGVVPFRSNGVSISISNGSRGPIQVSGVSQITCDEAISVGDYISNSTSVAGQGTGDIGQPERFVGRALETDASAPYNPTVLIIPQTSSNFDINFTAPATAGSDFDIIQVKIDIGSLDATSAVHVFDISTIGTSSGIVEGIVTHGGNISPIHQHTGTFITPSQTEYAGEIPSGGSWSDGLDTKTIFEDDDDEILIGSTGVFDSMEVLLSTVASQAEFAVYEFLNDSAAWVAFTPGDTTNDWRQNGIISWESAGFTNWDAAGDPGGAEASAGYWIRVRRTRNTVTTDPVVTTIKILDPTEYKWDANGDVDIHGIIVADSAAMPDAADPTVNAAGEIATENDGEGSISGQALFTFYSGGTQYWGIAVSDLTGLTDRDAIVYDDATDTFILEAQEGASGEANTASNQGTDGVGVYDTKAGVDLQFRHIAPASARITTVLNGKDIDIDVDLTQLWNFGGGTMELPNSEGNGTLANAGEIHIDLAQDAIALHLGAGGEIAGEAQISALTSISLTLDPGTWYDINAQVFMFTIGDEGPNGLTIDEWRCSCNVDPDVEINANLKYADAWIGLANDVVIDIIDTTNGVSSEDTDANINGGVAVANGKVVYLEFDADPEGTCVQMIFEMWYHAEED